MVPYWLFFFLLFYSIILVSLFIWVIYHQAFDFFYSISVGLWLVDNLCEENCFWSVLRKLLAHWDNFVLRLSKDNGMAGSGAKSCLVYDTKEFVGLLDNIRVSEFMKVKPETPPIPLPGATSEGSLVTVPLDDLRISDTLYCSYCSAGFLDKEGQRAHYKVCPKINLDLVYLLCNTSCHQPLKCKWISEATFIN